MAAMADEIEVRVGVRGSPKVKTIHRKALQDHLNKGYFLVDASGAPVDADGNPYELDPKGDPIIPEPTAEQKAEAERITRPATKEFLAEQKAQVATVESTAPNAQPAAGVSAESPPTPPPAKKREG